MVCVYGGGGASDGHCLREEPGEGGGRGSEWIDAEPLAGTVSDASLCNVMDALVMTSSSLCRQQQHRDEKKKVVGSESPVPLY